MENRNKYLWILALVSLTFGSATFNSYAQVNAEKVKKEEPIRIYGHANIEASHNIQQKYSEEYSSFTPSLIPMTSNQKKLSNALMYDASLKIGFETKFYIEERFSKGIAEFVASKNDSLSIHRLYFETENFSLGLKENNFCNIATFGPVKVIQASWKNKYKNNFTFAIGIEENKTVTLYPEKANKYKGMTKDQLEAKPFQSRRNFPAASTNLQYDFSDNFGSIALSGIVRPMSFYDSGSKDHKTPLLLGWGANLGTKLKLRPKVNILTANILFGQGIGSYVHDLKEMGKVEEADAYIKKGTDNEVKTIMVGGAHASFEHRWSPALHFNICAGANYTFNQDKNDREDGKDAYKLGVYAGAHAKYWITKRAAVGAEYTWGGRKNLDDNFKNAHHIKAVATFKF
ncbi:hypothetical protein Aasi_0258 [Candidatus Amoebophilus asiaticus 5a2]|uniref:Porin domain-containing protein n=1 Tax=Amoebophilus asiaticus (strain 5a2) TaxID=452471 RepID=B3ER49_AMOA5|nr:hypothetical protein [Candidatus Amoebophilus asiaticus]ACE05701.1 hypothetical protein Aasi_0258 [Candidatus Amoebophilus asiaticus 5a2]